MCGIFIYVPLFLSCTLDYYSGTLAQSDSWMTSAQNSAINQGYRKTDPLQIFRDSWKIQSRVIGILAVKKVLRAPIFLHLRNFEKERYVRKARNKIVRSSRDLWI